MGGSMKARKGSHVQLLGSFNTRNLAMMKNISYYTLFILFLILMTGSSMATNSTVAATTPTVATKTQQLRVKSLINFLARKQAEFHKKYFTDPTNTQQKANLMKINELSNLKAEVDNYQTLVEEIKGKRADLQSYWQGAISALNELGTSMPDADKLQTQLTEIQNKLSTDWSQFPKIYGFTRADLDAMRVTLGETCVEPECSRVLKIFNSKA